MYDVAIRPRKAELAKPIHNATPYFKILCYTIILNIFFYY